jgi:hypothetical protein
MGLAPPNIAPVAEDLMGLYIIIFSGAILGGAEHGVSPTCTNVIWEFGDLGLILVPKTYLYDTLLEEPPLRQN